MFSKYWQSFADSPGWGPRGMAAVGLEAYALGVGGGIAVALALTSALPSVTPFLTFCAVLSIFHMTEFLFAAIYHSYSCSTESFLIPHSTAYSMAMAVSVVEYWIEWLLFPAGSLSHTFFYIGLALCVAGQCLRWVSFITAGHNFTHIVSERKQAEHVLVKDGIYRYVRHPGYCGWFWWSVASQMMLANPISTLGFAYFSWKFFVNRIAHEESLLESEQFFGKEYTEYKKQVPTYIPFIM